MGRPPRIDVADIPYHVINRSNNRVTLFGSEQEFRDFEYLLDEARLTFDLRILAYTIMPNHWHLLLYPKKDGDLSKSIHWLSTSHALRIRTRNGTLGNGHVYQGRYKSFLIEKDVHFLTVLKYIERNPVRAGLVLRPDEWKWGSAHHRIHSSNTHSLLSELPVDLPRDYSGWINSPEPSENIDIIRHSVRTCAALGKVDITTKH